MDRVCHFEIPYADKARVSRFYQDVFGWQVVDVPGGISYSFVLTIAVDDRMLPTAPGGINGGMCPRGNRGRSNSPVVVIEVASSSQRVANVEAAGGSCVLSPTEISNMGIYGQVKDSEGLFARRSLATASSSALSCWVRGELCARISKLALALAGQPVAPPQLFAGRLAVLVPLGVRRHGRQPGEHVLQIALRDGCPVLRV